MTDTSTIPVTLKWGKQSFSLDIHVGEPAIRFKERIHTHTGVPVGRQKLLAKKGWKGSLKDDVILDAMLFSDRTKPFLVTLIGSAESLTEPAQKTLFLEDLSPQDRQRQEEAELQAAMGSAIGMIPALQLPPHRRDDGKQEFYEYNRLVTGLPQRQIEQELQASGSEGLQGKVAMKLGLELRRAYINDLAVLEDGTVVSVLDDGHVQLWKHAAQQGDVVHPGPEGPVNSVVALKGGAFATAGRGSLQLWNAEAEPIVTLPGAMPGTTPASLTLVVEDDTDQVTCLAARFQITRTSDPQQFRLPPQNDAERERRAQAEAQERAIQFSLAKAARSIQVWFSLRGSMAHLQSQILEPPSFEQTGAAPITCLTRMSLSDGTTLLIAGDAQGGIRLSKVQLHGNGLHFEQYGFYRLSGSCIVCIEALQNNRLAVSTDVFNHSQVLGEWPIAVSTPRAVHILNFSNGEMPTLQATLTGHDKDAVICMRQLPNGDLITGGGKLDATSYLWSISQLETNNHRDSGATVNVISKAHKTLTDLGYVFAIEVLTDAKKDSNYFALAVARYNTIKIML